MEESELKDRRPLKEKIRKSISDTEFKKESFSDQIDKNKPILLAALAAAFMLSFTIFATYNSFLSTSLTKKQIPPRLEKISGEFGKCKISGCNNEICSEKEMSSICLYSDKYACYKTAVCEVQEDGECGWTFDENLVSCLEQYVPEPSM